MLKKIIKSKFIQSLKYGKIIYFFKYKKLQFDFNILTPENTVDTILKNKLSVSRFGDGELNIMFHNKGIGFQPFNSKLREELFQVMNDTNIYVSLPYGFINTQIYKLNVAIFWWKYTYKNQHNINELVEKSGKYELLDTNFSRTVTELKNIDDVKRILSKVKRLWEDRNVVIVEGEFTKFGVGNNLLVETRSIRRIIMPAENAYLKIDELENSSIKLANSLENPLFLIAGGPTATVLSARLANKHIQSIDIGHFDLQYEYWLKGKTKRVKIQDKYDNELGNVVFDNQEKNRVWIDQIYKDYS